MDNQSLRDGFGLGLLKAAQKNPKIVALSADLSDSCRLTLFKKEFPQRFFQIGIAEQNMIGIAAGLALEGKIPFTASFAIFSPGQNWAQIRLSVCYQNTNVKIIGSHSGVQTGPDGATHQGIEDIALTRCLPNMTVIAPADALEAEKATLAIAEHQGPCYLRLTNSKTPQITKSQDPFIIGQAQIITKGQDITLIACGPIINEALKARKALKSQNISLEIINLSTIKPLDKQTILKSVSKTQKLITLEDHQIMGGMGSAVIEMLSQNYPVPVRMIGIQDQFGQSGQADELWHEYGIDSPAIQTAVKKVLSRK